MEFYAKVVTESLQIVSRRLIANVLHTHMDGLDTEAWMGYPCTLG